MTIVTPDRETPLQKSCSACPRERSKRGERPVNRLDNPRHAVLNFLGRAHIGVCNYRSPQRREVMREIRQLKKARKMLLTPLEAHQLFVAAKGAAHVPGDVAEVGVYRGASARLLQQAMPEKQLHLFDTFAGLPGDAPGHPKGDLACPLDSVRAYVGNAKLYPGLFPEQTGYQVAALRFSFVHLDMDLYQGTLQALAFFYPRMSAGGIILSHDYNWLPGPTDACRQFFDGKPEPLIELSGHQCLTVRLAG